MKVTLILPLVSLLLFSQTSFSSSIPKPVNHVSPKSFVGLWYEIARTYNKFEENCVAPTIEYEYINNNELKVFNRCFENQIGSNLISYTGIAKSLEDNNLARFKKTYYWIFTKEYRIIYLDKLYKTAIMSDKEMQNVWIMHRNPFMQKDKLDDIINYLNNYMDTSKLIFTKQDKNGRYK